MTMTTAWPWAIYIPLFVSLDAIREFTVTRPFAALLLAFIAGMFAAAAIGITAALIETWNRKHGGSRSSNGKR